METQNAREAVDRAVVRYLTGSLDGDVGAAAIDLVDLLLAIADETVEDMEVVDGKTFIGAPIDSLSAHMANRTSIGMILGEKFRKKRGWML